MKINDFNAKIDLPRICADNPELKARNYGFTKVPGFGYFAHNSQEIMAGYDLFPEPGKKSLFHRFARDKKYLLFSVAYSQTAADNYDDNLLNYRYWQDLHRSAIKEMDAGMININKVISPIREIIEKKLYRHIWTTGCGFLGADTQDKFPKPFLNFNLANRLVIPHYCAPGHICSLDYVYIHKLNEPRKLWPGFEPGWTGTLSEPRVVENFETACLMGGFTWDSKVPYWNTQELSLDPELTVPTLVYIIDTCRNTKFTVSPMRRLATHKEVINQRHYFNHFTVDQIKELETLGGISLLDAWKLDGAIELQLGPHRFKQENDCWYIHRKNRWDLLCNFVIKADKLLVKGPKAEDKFLVGHVRHKGSVYPFELPAIGFETDWRLRSSMRAYFMDHGIEMPEIPAIHPFKLLAAFETFNKQVPVEKIKAP